MEVRSTGGHLLQHRLTSSRLIWLLLLHSACLAMSMQLDERQDGEAIQDYLNQLTGGRSVPRVFVGGNFIGGGDDTVSKQQSGELKKILQQAGAL